MNRYKFSKSLGDYSARDAGILTYTADSLAEAVQELKDTGFHFDGWYYQGKDQDADKEHDTGEWDTTSHGPRRKW